MQITRPVCERSPSSGLTSWLKCAYIVPARPLAAVLRVKATVFQSTTSTPRLAAATSSSRIACRNNPARERSSRYRPLWAASSTATNA